MSDRPPTVLGLFDSAEGLMAAIRGLKPKKNRQARSLHAVSLFTASMKPSACVAPRLGRW